MKKLPSYIFDFLLQHGFEEDELRAKSQEEIWEIYHQGVSKFIKNFLPDQKPSSTQPNFNNPFLALQSPLELYEMNLDFFLEIPFTQVIRFIQKHFTHLPFEKAQRIAIVLGYSFQEELLQRIKEQISHLPPQEQQDILEIYQSQENNLSHLITIHKKLQSPHFREQLEQVIQIKNTIQDLKNEIQEIHTTS